MWVAALLVVVALGLLVALTRIVAERWYSHYYFGHDSRWIYCRRCRCASLGCAGRGETLGYTLVWVRRSAGFYDRSFGQYACAWAATLAGDRRRLLWGLAAAMLISLVLSTWSTRCT